MIHDFILREFNHRSFIRLTASSKIKDSCLEVSWIITGNISEIIVSQENPGIRKEDRLWENTCFEIFLKQKDQESYFEYNFSANQNWNCYRFSSYRSEMTSFESKLPLILFKPTSKSLVLSVKIEIPSELQNKNDLTIGIAAVINTKDGLTYWALQHPRDKPDFHSHFEPITT